MYSEWVSFRQELQQSDGTGSSVLHSFPETVGKDVSGIVVRNLAHSLGVSVSSGEPSCLKTDKEVSWTMEVRILHVHSAVYTTSLIQW